MAKKLRALSEYTSAPRNLAFKHGEVFDASDELYLFLKADAPENFEEVEEENPHLPEEYWKAVDAPPVDKMVRVPKAKK